MNEEDFFGIVTVLRVQAPFRLPRAAYIEAVRNLDVDMLAGVFGDTRADNAKVLFLVAAGRPRIDKRRFAGD